MTLPTVHDEILYSDMSDRELLEHVARNTDQIIGFCRGVSAQINGFDVSKIPAPLRIMFGLGK